MGQTGVMSTIDADRHLLRGVRCPKGIGIRARTALTVLLVVLPFLVRPPSARATLSPALTAGFLDFAGTTRSFTDAASEVVVYTDNSTDHVRVFVQRPKGCYPTEGTGCTDNYVVRLQAPVGQPLGVGTYEYDPSVGTNGAWDAVSVNSLDGQPVHYFTPQGGRFIIDQIAYSGTTITALSARFQASGASDGFSNGVGMPIFGAFSYQANADFRTEDITPGRLSFGTVQQGAQVTETSSITNNGPSPLAFTGPMSLTGANAGDFSVGGNTCQGAILSSGQGCHITVSYRPTTSGDETADLAFNNDLAPAPGPGRVIRLTASAPTSFIPPPQPPSTAGPTTTTTPGSQKAGVSNKAGLAPPAATRAASTASPSGVPATRTAVSTSSTFLPNGYASAADDSVPMTSSSAKVDRVEMNYGASPSVHVVAHGFLALSRVTAVLHSQTVVLGNATSDGAGHFDAIFMIPAGVHAGSHFIELIGRDASGAQATVTAPLRLDLLRKSHRLNDVDATGAGAAALLLLACLGVGFELRKSARPSPAPAR
jgi:hypothetical protein